MSFSVNYFVGDVKPLKPPIGFALILIPGTKDDNGFLRINFLVGVVLSDFLSFFLSFLSLSFFFFFLTSSYCSSVSVFYLLELYRLSERLDLFDGNSTVCFNSAGVGSNANFSASDFR